MIFLISTVLATFFALVCGKMLRRYPAPFYTAAAVFSLIGIWCTWYGPALPHFFTNWVLPVFSRGGLAGALFVIVMCIGAFPNGSAPMKRLMPIRGELSILASILTLGHNIAYGKVYFVQLFRNPTEMPIFRLLAALCSIAMIFIMIPLFLTSFKKIRRRISAKKWKRLQRLAYLFYSLMYVHVMLLNVPFAVSGRVDCVLNVFLYSAVFLSYLICRILKYTEKRQPRAKTLPKKQFVGILCGIIAAAFIMVICLFYKSFLPPKPSEAEIVTNAVDNEIENESDDASDEDEHGTYHDGVYTGNGMGMNSKITVSVTIENDIIRDVVIESAREDEPYFSDAQAVIEDILAVSGTDVDTVSGATYSSGGIIDAVADALEKAKYGKDNQFD